MENISPVLNGLFRWIHVIAGILWIGHLYFFNFVNIPFAAKMKEAGASKTVVPELMPRALFWFRSASSLPMRSTPHSVSPYVDCWIA